MISSSLTPPSFDQATIDAHVEAGKRARSRAIRGMVASLFSAERSRPRAGGRVADAR